MPKAKSMTENAAQFNRMSRLPRGPLALAAGLLLLCAGTAAHAQTNFAVVVEDAGWCWYSDPRAMFHNGKLYVGYVAPGRNKTVLDVFDLTTGVGRSLWYSGFSSTDDHNVPGLCIREDGTILALYATHGGENYFRYRSSTSTNPVIPGDWSAEQLGPSTGSGVTYCNPFQLTGEGNKIYNFSRVLYYNPTVFTSVNGGSTWSSAQRFIATGTGGVRPYVKYCSDGVGRIDFLYTDGHPRDVANSLYHLYYQAGTFYRTDGTFVKHFADLPILHDSGERGSVIYQYSDAAQSDPNAWIPTGRAWCWEVAHDTNGTPVCVFTVQRDLVTGPTSGVDDRIYYYYARWTGSAWQKRFIAHAGRPLYVAEDDYAGGICVDPQDPNVIYLSSNAQDPFNLSDPTNVPLRANSRYEIWRGVTSDGGLTFNWTQITTNSIQDNLRPYIPRRNGGEPCVLWFRGSYSTYTSYSGSLVGLFTSAVPTPLPQPPINYVDASSGAGGNTMQWTNTQSWIVWTPPLNIASTSDHQWEEETGTGWGNGPTSNWFESNREGTEDCPQLRPRVEGLAPGTYNVFAYFWVANGQGFKFGAALTNHPTGSLPLYAVGSFGVKAAVQGSFASSVMVTSADRTLYQVSLGTVTGSTVTVYIDDDANGGYSSSCWYDGIGYQLQLAQSRPELSVRSSGDSVIVSWPESHRGWMLESASSLSGTWTDVAGSDTNTAHGIVSSNTAQVGFFRLRYPYP